MPLEHTSSGFHAKQAPASTIRTSLVRTAAAALFLCIGMYPSYAEEPADGDAQTVKKPNVLWILEDACRADHLSCHGYARRTTPVLDRLAKRGVLFLRNYSQASHTVRSLPSYITGRHFPVHNLVINTINWEELGRVPPPGEKMAPEIFRDAGYSTHLVGTSIWIVEDTRLWDAFDHNLYLGGQEGRVYAPLKELRPHILEAVDRAGDKPFFLYVHALDTHAPHYHRKLYPEWFPMGEIGDRPRPPFNKRGKAWLKAEYDTSLVYCDTVIGQILDDLDTQGVLENTIIVFSSDHGELLGEDGHSLNHYSGGYTDEQIHTPLIMAGPGLPKGRRVEALTENTDILPTLYELIGANTPAEFDGKSLVSLAHGAHPDPLRDFAFSRIGTRHPWFVLTGNEYKYFDRRRDGSGELFALPDLLGRRKSEENPAVRVAAAELVRSRYLPAFNAYWALPFKRPQEFYIRLNGSEFRDNPNVVRKEHVQDDNKWSYHEKALRSFTATEDAPPLEFAVRVPNGTWRVELFLERKSYQFPKRKPTRLKVAVEGGPSQQLPPDDVVEEASGKEGEEWYWVQAGIHTVKDRTLDLVIDETGPKHLAGMRWLRFTFLSGREDSPKPPGEQDLETMRALGYL